MENNTLKTAQEIAEIYDYLFSSVEGAPTLASIWGIYYRTKNTKNISGKKGYYLPPVITYADSPIPMNTYPGEIIDVELCFDVNGPKSIEVLKLKTKEDKSLFTIEDIFKAAILNAGGDLPIEAETKTGYISKAFEGQNKKNTYKVELFKSGLYSVEIRKGEGNKAYWKPWKLGSPKAKAVINDFNAAVENNTLQTTFVN